MAVSRFSYASLKVLDVEAAVKHYTDVVGLRLVSTSVLYTYVFMKIFAVS